MRSNNRFKGRRLRLRRSRAPNLSVRRHREHVVSFIDWSDPEEMFGLLVEYVTDEESEAEDSKRRRFLASLKRQLEDLQQCFGGLPLVECINALRAIHRGVEEDFENDPVVEHLDACVNELERVHESAG